MKPVRGVPGLDLLPSDIWAAGLEEEIVSYVGCERLVRRLLEPVGATMAGRVSTACRVEGT